MFLNLRYPIVLFALSFIGTMIGMLFKIQHWPGGSLIMGSMLIVQSISIAWLVVILLRNKDKKSE
jgi:hypothetical protein